MILVASMTYGFSGLLIDNSGGFTQVNFSKNGVASLRDFRGDELLTAIEEVRTELVSTLSNELRVIVSESDLTLNQKYTLIQSLNIISFSFQLVGT